VKQSRDTKHTHTHTHTHIQRSMSKETKGEVGHRTVVPKNTHTHTPKHRETGREGQGGQRERGTYRISKDGLGIIRHDAERRLARALHPFLRISLPLPSCSCCLLLLSPLLSRCFHLMLSSSSSSSYPSTNTYNLSPHNCTERDCRDRRTQQIPKPEILMPKPTDP
jgi:hypothetical protein